MSDITDPMERQSPARRAAAYWFIDGLPEIGFGSVFLMWSALGLAWGYRPDDWWTRWPYVVAVVISLIFYIWDRNILDFFKARLTYPRTGYVGTPRESQRQGSDPFLPREKTPPSYTVTMFGLRIAYWFILAPLFVNCAVVMAGGETGRWCVPVIMTVVAALEYRLNRESRRYPVWSVATIAAAGFASLAWKLPARSIQFVPLLIGALWLSAHGWWRLVHYVRANPRHRVPEGV